MKSKSMALAQLLLLGATLALAFFSCSEAGEIGVCYGMMASHLIAPPDVVKLLQNKGIKVVTLYDANREALTALANTGIKVGVSVPNQNLADAAGGMPYALQWVLSNVKAYPNTLIDSVAVGNEVFHQVPGLTPQLLPAMKNIHAALVSLGLADRVKVITPIAMDALKDPSFPPSVGEFKDGIAQLVMKPMMDFLEQTGSFLSFNIYPYFAYKAKPNEIDINFVLFRTNNGQRDQNTGLTYYNLFDAMVDAVFHAVEKVRRSSSLDPEHGGGRRRMLASSDDDSLVDSMRVKESGFGSGQIGPLAKNLKHSNASESAAQNQNTAYAQTYNQNLIGKILRGGGTPYKPNAVISANIFSLFNEDLKPGDESERHFGLFNPDGTPVYQVDFINPGLPPAPAAASWCTAKPAAGNLQDALDYACGHGADCSAIQPGKPCYQPNTLVAHASYAFDAYYQSQGRASGTCDFSGAGTIVYQKPTGTCDASSSAKSWCTAKKSASTQQLQDALDYACGHGADCSAIQPGGRCFDPNSVYAHASYAFNDYYQHNGMSDASCNFGGCGNVVNTQPTFGNCVL